MALRPYDMLILQANLCIGGLTIGFSRWDMPILHASALHWSIDGWVAFL